MTTNPGGQLAPNEVIGRDEFIARLWRILEKRSAIVTAERRMGKTQIVKKMEAESPSGVLSVYHDLEHVATPLEFAELTFQDVERHLKRSSRIANKTRAFLAHLQGVEMAGIVKFPPIAATHWKTLLAHTIEDLAGHHEQLIFFWDEVPLMLHKIANQSGEREAMELLDLLRSLRSSHPRLRMVFTGSIGLHHVLTALRKGGYANRPTNDMAVIELLPLTREYGRLLARELIFGEQLILDDPEKIAVQIADAADNVPFFIHHLVDALVLQPSIPVLQLLDAHLLDPSDPWDISHFMERVPRYYGENATVALAILDAVAASEKPLTYGQIENRVKAKYTTLDGEHLRELLTSLQRDHYLQLDDEGRYNFQLHLVLRAWYLHRISRK